MNRRFVSSVSSYAKLLGFRQRLLLVRHQLKTYCVVVGRRLRSDIKFKVDEQITLDGCIVERVCLGLERCGRSEVNPQFIVQGAPLLGIQDLVSELWHQILRIPLPVVR